MYTIIIISFYNNYVNLTDKQLANTFLGQHLTDHLSYQSNSAECVNNLADVNFMATITSHNFHWNRNLLSNYYVNILDTK